METTINGENLNCQLLNEKITGIDCSCLRSKDCKGCFIYEAECETELAFKNEEKPLTTN